LQFCCFGNFFNFFHLFLPKSVQKLYNFSMPFSPSSLSH
jgi:hypothetical protein